MGGKTLLEMISTMCMDASYLYCLSCKDKDGSDIGLLLSEGKALGKTFLFHQLPALHTGDQRLVDSCGRLTFHPSRSLSMLERGVEWVHKNNGVHKAL